MSLPLTSINPATGEPVWQGHSATTQEVNLAIQKAQEAFEHWSSLLVDERALYLDSFCESLKKHQSELAEVISIEMGKPLYDSTNEVQSMINKVKLTLEAYGNRCANIIHQTAATKSITRHRPHGVVAVFGPYNFPGHLPNGHIIPALLAGNTVVFKPSELTPLVAETTMKIWQEAKLPDGVLNLVQGGKETGQAILEHSGIKGIFFTGSYPTGMIIAERFVKQPGKILALEMGGNNPLVVGKINDIEAAAYLTVQSAYLTSGQRCTCARRLIVIKNSQSDKFIDRLKSMITGITVGPYTDTPEPFMGPVVSESQVLKLLKIQQEFKSKGGVPIIEMKHIKAGTGLISPGFMDVTKMSDRPDEEVFGPFLQLIHVNSLQEALAEANRTKYGLSSGILTDNEDEWDYFYRHSEAGVINWNMPLTGASSAAPFGGIKCSGNHRPSAFYAVDYCSYPVASLQSAKLKMPDNLVPGLNL